MKIPAPLGPGVVIREARPGADADAAAALMVAYLTWGHQRLREEYGIEEAPSNPAHVVASLAGYQPPGGTLLIAERDGRAVGVGALRRLGADVAEVKRMYVAPEARSLHLGSALLDRLILTARAWNARVLRLDTVRFMADAQRLYRSRGFVERPPYEGTEIPPQLQKYWLFFERPLQAEMKPWS